MWDQVRIIDISQPVSERSAHFPGDVPFSKKLTLTYEQSKVINLTELTMSPHVGTHTDAPIHCYGDLSAGRDTAGLLPLEPYLGPGVVIDISPTADEIRPQHLETKLAQFRQFPKRVLIKTVSQSKAEVFEPTYSYLSVELVRYLADNGVLLVGVDTPSVDHATSKTLDAHHALIAAKMCWLENLDLTSASEGEYIVVALPLKFMDLEASPVRAVLLANKS